MPNRRFPPPWPVEELDAGFVVREGELPRILKINFSQRKHHGDHSDNDDKGHKRKLSGPGFSLRCGPPRACKSDIEMTSFYRPLRLMIS
jgi:hypothetical protein